MLHRVVESAGPRVVLVHGFTQTVVSWDTVATGLAAQHEVVRLDLPGHGGSAGVGLTFAETAEAIGEAGGRAAFVGYSLGGRLCLRLAVDRPDLVRALVLVSASPGLDDPAERAARRRHDEAMAARIEADGTTAFVDQWLGQPMFAGLHVSPGDRAARRANPPDGLADALRLLGTGAQEPLWDRLGELTMPALLMVGENDPKFDAIAVRMAAAIPAATVVRVAGAGHAVHLERPREWTAAVTTFLEASDDHHAS